MSLCCFSFQEIGGVDAGALWRTAACSPAALLRGGGQPTVTTRTRNLCPGTTITTTKACPESTGEPDEETNCTVCWTSTASVKSVSKVTNGYLCAFILYYCTVICACLFGSFYVPGIARFPTYEWKPTPSTPPVPPPRTPTVTNGRKYVIW